MWVGGAVGAGDIIQSPSDMKIYAGGLPSKTEKWSERVEKHSYRMHRYPQAEVTTLLQLYEITEGSVNVKPGLQKGGWEGLISGPSLQIHSSTLRFW